MSFSRIEYTGDGVTTDYTYSTERIADIDVVALVDDVATSISLVSGNTFRFNVAPVDGAAIVLYRQTDIDATRYAFPNRSYLRHTSLDGNSEQRILALQELRDEDDVLAAAIVETDAKTRTYAAGAGMAVSDSGAVVTYSNIGDATGFDGNVYTDLSVALAATSSIGDIVRTAEYFAGTALGGATYRVVAAATGTVDGGSYIDKTDGSGYQLELLEQDRRLSVEQFGVVSTGDMTTRVQACLDFATSAGIPEVHTNTDFEFSNITIPFATTLVGGTAKNVVITSNAVTGDAVTLEDDPSNAGNFFNGLNGITISATAARIAGAGRGIFASSGDPTKVAFKVTITNVIVQNQPGIGCELVQPEMAHVDLITQTNGDSGFVISVTGDKGINNLIHVRAIDNVGIQIVAETANSHFELCEALVRGDAPVYTGTLMSIAGNGNRITSPDIELNGNPSDANIMLCTGLLIAGDQNKLEGGFFGNLGIAVDVGGRGSYVNNPKINIFSTAATNPVVGSIGIRVKAGAEGATINHSEFGTTKVETYLSDLSADTAAQTAGTYNGLGKVVTGSTTWDPANMAIGGSQTVTFAITGAVLGAPCIVGHTGITGGTGKVILSATAVNGSVIVVVKNETVGTLDIPSGTLTVKVFL